MTRLSKIWSWWTTIFSTCTSTTARSPSTSINTLPTTLPEQNSLPQAPMHSSTLSKKRLLPMKSLDQTLKATDLWQSGAHAALAQDRIPRRAQMILSAWRSVARTVFNSVAQLLTAAEITGVHTATRFDKAVFGRNGAAEHMLASSRSTNVCLLGFCRLSFNKTPNASFSQSHIRRLGWEWNGICSGFFYRIFGRDPASIRGKLDNFSTVFSVYYSFLNIARVLWPANGWPSLNSSGELHTTTESKLPNSAYYFCPLHKDPY